MTSLIIPQFDVQEIFFYLLLFFFVKDVQEILLLRKLTFSRLLRSSSSPIWSRHRIIHFWGKAILFYHQC